MGEHLRDQYRTGDRFIVQADIYVNGVGYAYGYEIQGGLSQYNVIYRRVLNGDHGCYLISVQPTTGYAEAEATAIFAQRDVTVRMALGLGDGAATVWTCDLSHDYVTINGDYRT